MSRSEGERTNERTDERTNERMNHSPASVRPTLTFVASALVMLALFRALDTLVVRLAALPASAYTQPFFLDELPSRWWHLASSRLPWWIVAAGITLVALAAVADARWRAGGSRRRLASIFHGWDALREGSALRLLVLAVSGITTYALSCYARNLYVDQLHLADRLLLVALWLGIVWRPICVLPYAVVAGAIAGQFTVPLGFISWTEMGVLLHLPVLFAAFWIVRSVTGDRRSEMFIFGWCCLIAATYWTSGLGKLRIEWFMHPHIALLMLGAYANGWLAFLDESVVVHVAGLLERVARPLMLLTLVLECGALVLLWRRWSLVGFFVLATLFHLGVSAMTGIVFWKWILADAFLLIYLLRDDRLARLALFTPARFGLSVVAILASPLWIRAENLTWFDTPLTYSLRYEGVAVDGVTYPLASSFFRPYTEAIVLGTFAQVSPHVQLTRGMGVTLDRRLAEALEAARTPAEVYEIETRLGTVLLDPVAVAAFDDFVARYAANARCDARRDPLVLRLIGAPRHLWTTPLHSSPPCDVPLASVRVLEQTSFFDGSHLRVIRQRLLRNIRVVHPPVPNGVDEPEGVR